MSSKVYYVLLPITSLLSVLYFYYKSTSRNIWEQLGIPGPKRDSVSDPRDELRTNFPQVLGQWREKYGRTYGVYGLQRNSPTLVTTDLGLLNHIMVKDFNNFRDRYFLNLTHSSVTDGLFFLSGSQWRRNRHVMTPLFTPAKLKTMLGHANSSAQSLVELVKEYKKDGELIPAKKLAAKFASDVIAKSGFGLDGQAVTKEDNEFFFNINRYLVIGTLPQKIFNFLTFYFPALADPLLTIFPSMDVIPREADHYFIALAEAALNRKRRDKESGREQGNAKDMLDHLVDVEVENDVVLKEGDRAMTRNEIIGNSTLLIFAAYETTSSCLMSTMYCLAKYPDVQETLIAEVDRVMQGRRQPEYDDLVEMKYMEQVINESMRMFPPVAHLKRVPRETKTYDGVTIPKGTNVYIPLLSMMSDPEYWPNPDQFDPGRFSPDKSSELDTLKFMPFGVGPRHCIGQRFALMELKVALSQLLSSVRFVLTEQTEPKLGSDVFTVALVAYDFPFPAKPILLDVTLREGNN
ncbi:unnamed protein product [Lymnaea stagnalis]|uniref:Cytochrome P450 n=1 Tax=Lymnaea stagnalis TaxID=6523 RepID=A0AAV2HS01_LYMST